MKNYWLQLRKRKTVPTFHFELMGRFPRCDVHLDNGVVAGHITLKSTNPKFVAFVKTLNLNKMPTATDGFLSVFVNGKEVESWAFIDVKIGGYGNDKDPLGNERGWIFASCSNAAGIKSKYFRMN